MEIKCSQCGAYFDDNEPKCPYCDAFNYKGAETEYMEKMEDILDDLEDLKDIPEETYREEAKIHVRHTGHVAALVLTVVLIAAAVIGGVCLLFNKKENKQRKAQLFFEREYFSQLDEWYEQEEYDAICEFEEKMQAGEGSYHIYNWSHYSFLIQYRNYKWAMETGDYISGENDWDDQDVELLLDSFAQLAYFDTYYEEYTKRDRQRIDEYKAEVSERIQSLFDLSEDDVEDFLDNVHTDEQWMDYDYCESYAAQLTEKMGGDKR